LGHAPSGRLFLKSFPVKELRQDFGCMFRLIRLLNTLVAKRVLEVQYP
jgi:hypothetical protein